MTTVLIADDEKDIRSALKIYLKPEGYELLCYAYKIMSKYEYC